jgi:hypothetical protein
MSRIVRSGFDNEDSGFLFRQSRRRKKKKKKAICVKS